jgi:ElaB/YqjD/DUF883 family membrane-anchored ribosome-binding protein
MDTQRAQELQDRARELQEQLGPGVEQARQNLIELNRRVSGFIRENPGTCLLGAIALGFVVGKFASRR